MLGLKTVGFFFYLAVLLFIAKPFLGFALISPTNYSKAANSILVKSFAKRKPEDFKEAKASQEAIHFQLNNPPLVLAITLLLAILFPTLFRRIALINNCYTNNIKLSLIPIEQTYLLTGKLSI